jgi:hypothetical protein
MVNSAALFPSSPAESYGRFNSASAGSVQVGPPRHFLHLITKRFTNASLFAPLGSLFEPAVGTVARVRFRQAGCRLPTNDLIVQPNASQFRSQMRLAGRGRSSPGGSNSRELGLSRPGCAQKCSDAKLATMTIEEKPLLLSARRLPARLDTEQLALLLGIHADDVGLLVSSRLLRPLGHPNKSAPKFFIAAQWEELRQDSR